MIHTAVQSSLYPAFREGCALEMVRIWPLASRVSARQRADVIREWLTNQIKLGTQQGVLRPNGQTGKVNMVLETLVGQLGPLLEQGSDAQAQNLTMRLLDNLSIGEVKVPE